MAIEDVGGKALVTGGGGLIGSRLVLALLARGARVKVLDTRHGFLEGKVDPHLEFVGVGSDSFVGCMASRETVREAVRDVDVIYHLAINWNGHTWRHEHSLADLFDVNVKGTVNLLEEARRQGLKHFLFASSCAVYGQPDTLIVDEESVCKPESWDGDTGRAYGIVKLATERLCLMYCLDYGLPVTAFRIDFVFDEDQALPSRIIEEALSKGEIIEVVEGDGYASIHVDDVVSAFLLATLNKSAYGQVFNLSNPATYISYRELYELLIKSTGSRSEIRLTSDPTHVSRALESNDKIRNMLSWTPQKNKEELVKAVLRSIRPRNRSSVG